MRYNKKLFLKKKTCIVLKDPKNRDFISAIKYVSDDGLVIPNIVTLSGKSYLKKFFFNNNLNKNIRMAVNDIKYNDNKLSFY